MARRAPIAVVIYANPDEYPVTVSAVHILAERGHRVCVIARHQNAPTTQYPPSATVYRLGDRATSAEHARQPRLSRLLDFLRFVSATRTLIRRHECRLVLAYDLYALGATAIAVGWGGHAIPFIYHNHDLAAGGPAVSLRAWLKRLEPLFARRAQAVVFPEAQRARIFHRRARLRTLPLVVPNFPRLRATVPLPLLRSELAERGVVFQYIILRAGTIGDGHCISETLEALTLLPPTFIAVFCGFASDDYVAAARNQGAALGLASRVFFFPNVPAERWLGYVASADVGLATYGATSVNNRYMATASNKLFLYAMCGVPAVASDTPEFRSVVDGYGLGRCVDPGSPQETANAILELTKPDVRRAAAALARDAHLRALNYEVAITPLLSAIERLVPPTEAHDPTCTGDAGQ